MRHAASLRCTLAPLGKTLTLHWQTYRNIRLDRARTLLMETNLSVMEASRAAGFNADNVFSRHFTALL
ncbi:MAG: helix-turn-helix domain-containing protein [Sulfitobacter sp.]